MVDTSSPKGQGSTKSGQLHTPRWVSGAQGPGDDARHCRTGSSGPGPARAAAMLSQACRYTSSYLTLRHSRSTNTLSAHRPLPSMLSLRQAVSRGPRLRPLSASVNAAPVDCAPRSPTLRYARTSTRTTTTRLHTELDRATTAWIARLSAIRPGAGLVIPARTRFRDRPRAVPSGLHGPAS